MQWTPPTTMPALRKMLDDDAYNKQFADALNSVDRKKLESSEYVMPAPADGETVDGDTDWHADIRYWHSDQRSGQWDSQMLVACSCFETNPALAETALFHANEAGYDGWVLKSLMSRIAWEQIRVDDALYFSWLALQIVPADLKPLVAKWTFEAGGIDYKQPMQLDLAKLYTLDEPYQITGKRAAVRWYYAASWSEPRYEPIIELQSRHETDLSKQISRFPQKAEVFPPGAVDRLYTNGAITMSAPPGHRQTIYLGPAVTDADLTLDFRVRDSAQPDKNGEFDRSLDIGICNTKTAGPCTISLLPTGITLFNATGTLPTFPQVGPLRTGKLRIIVLGKDVEVFINDKKVYFSCMWKMPPPRQIIFYMETVGVRGTISNVSWKRIEPADAFAK